MLNYINIWTSVIVKFFYYFVLYFWCPCVWILAKGTHFNWNFQFQMLISVSWCHLALTDWSSKLRQSKIATFYEMGGLYPGKATCNNILTKFIGLFLEGEPLVLKCGDLGCLILNSSQCTIEKKSKEMKTTYMLCLPPEVVWPCVQTCCTLLNLSNYSYFFAEQGGFWRLL